MDCDTVYLPFFGAILGCIVGALITIYGERWLEKKKQEEKVIFNVYIKLLNISVLHFAIRNNSVTTSPERVEQFNKARWAISDDLRKIDHFPYIDEILRALFSLNFENENLRGKEIARVIGLLGEKINPYFIEVMTQISNENIKLAEENIEEYSKRKFTLENP